MYVRVKDENGAEFDVPEDSRLIQKGLVQLVKKVDPSPLPRPPKFKPTTAGAATHAVATEAPAVRPDQSASDQTPDATEKE